MKNARRMIGVLFLAAMSMMVLPTAEAQEAATSERRPESISGTLSASCLLKIVTDPSILSLDDGAITHLLRSSSVWDVAVEKTLGATPRTLNMTIEQDDAFVVARTLENVEIGGPPNEHKVLLLLGVNLPDWTKPMAKEVMEAMLTNLRRVVESACESEFNRLNNQVRLATSEIEHAEKEVMEIQGWLMEISDRDSSPETLRSSITEITSQLQSLQLEEASQEAYRQGILRRTSEIQAEVERTVREDAVAAELNQILQRRMADLKNVQGMVEAGRVPAAGLVDVEDRLAAARIDLARRREELARMGSAARLEQLTAELATLTLEAERRQAREKQLGRQLEETREFLGRAGNYERMMLKLDVAKQNLREAETLHKKTTQRVRMFRMPSISVIGG